MARRTSLRRSLAAVGLLCATALTSMALPAAADEHESDERWAEFLADRPALYNELAPPFVDCFQRRDSVIDPVSPIFHGCVDWHSAVHAAYSHLALYHRTGAYAYLDLIERKIAPFGVSLIPAEEAYQLTKTDQPLLTENPYGFGWFLVMAREYELATGKPDFRNMAAHAATEMVGWFEERRNSSDARDFILNTAHANYSWSLINLDTWARFTDDEALLADVRVAAEPLMDPQLDSQCPATRDTRTNPSGFQPACLMRLAAVAHIDGDEAKDWVTARLPVEALYVPPVTSPPDCHAGGQNFTRAFALYQLHLITGDSDYRDNYIELIRYHVGRPDLYAGQASYLDNPGYLCYSHWVAQLGVRAISRSYEEQYIAPAADEN